MNQPKYEEMKRWMLRKSYIYSLLDGTDKKLEEAGLSYSYASGAYNVRLRALSEAIDFLKNNEYSDFEILKGNMDDVFLNVTGKKIGGDYEK